MRRRAALLLAALAAPAAAAMPEPLPPYAAAYTPTTVDERGLWQQADEAERAMRDSTAIIRDPALNAYVRGVLCRAVGADRCKAVRLYIARVPAFNAFMMPNGTMQIWSGLLLRVRDEAELASVLGHEFGHFEMRHGLAGYKRQRGVTDVLAWASLTPSTASLSTPLIGMHFVHQRGQETEADLLGMRFLKASGYRPAAAAAVWQQQLAESDESALARRRRITHRYASGFLDTHPTHPQRIDTLRAAAGAEADRGDDGRVTFRQAMAPWRAQFLADQIKLNDFGGCEFLLAQLAGEAWTPDLLLARADLYRERGHPRDLVTAATLYQEAIDKGCEEPAAWRGLGVALLRGGQGDPGRKALARYLERAPDAPDRAAMTMLIGQGGTQ